MAHCGKNGKQKQYDNRQCSKPCQAATLDCRSPTPQKEYKPSLIVKHSEQREQHTTAKQHWYYH
jgi:hypothetical protein